MFLFSNYSYVNLHNVAPINSPILAAYSSSQQAQNFQFIQGLTELDSPPQHNSHKMFESKFKL